MTKYIFFCSNDNFCLRSCFTEYHADDAAARKRSLELATDSAVPPNMTYGTYEPEPTTPMEMRWYRVRTYRVDTGTHYNAPVALWLEWGRKDGLPEKLEFLESILPHHYKEDK